MFLQEHKFLEQIPVNSFVMVILCNTSMSGNSNVPEVQEKDLKNVWAQVYFWKSCRLYGVYCGGSEHLDDCF